MGEELVGGKKRWFVPQVSEIAVRATKTGTLTKIGTTNDMYSSEVGLTGSIVHKSGS